MEFENKYSSRAIRGGFHVIEAGFSMYDVLWVLAKGLNSTMAMIKSGNIGHTGCTNIPGSLVNFEDFNYTNMRMGCLIRWNLENTNFLGVSVSLFYIAILLLYVQVNTYSKRVTRQYTPFQ